MSAHSTLTFAELFSQGEWKAIAKCPGRFVLKAGHENVGLLQSLQSIIACERYRSHAARDDISITELIGGGLNSYHRTDGTCLHTLNTVEGFARKRLMLGV